MAELNEAFPNYKDTTTSTSTVPTATYTVPLPRHFPQYNNTNVDETVEALKKEHPIFDIHKVPTDSLVTADFRTGRIRVFYDPLTNLVSKTPHTG